MLGEEAAKYQYCGTNLTVKHVLLVCPIFNAMIQRLLSVQSLKDLFYKMDPEELLQFLSKVNLKKLLYNLISKLCFIIALFSFSILYCVLMYCFLMYNLRFP